MARAKLALPVRDMVATLKQRLQERHAGDIYTPEALTGWGGARRFDAWAMEPSWTKVNCFGYEIKVNRSDFTGDRKWTAYLPYCTEFYFVCPAGLIQPNELPPEAGLIWATANAGKIYKKKQGATREIGDAELSLMLRHVLMWRFHGTKSGADKARDWLRDVEEGRELDHRLKKAIVKAAGAHTARVLEENEGLRREQSRLSSVESWLRRNGIDISDSEWAILRQLDEAKKARADGITKELRDMVRSLRSNGRDMIRLADEIEGKPDPDDD